MRGNDRNKVHGCCTTPAYKCWTRIKGRCLNEQNTDYRHYGGRGIVVCNRWKDSFPNFLADMGQPAKGMTIERINNNGNYEPSNCRWATRKEQGNNRRNNIFVTIGTETKTVTNWCLQVGLRPQRAIDRIRLGWNPVEAVLTPLLRGTPKVRPPLVKV